jgi:hypothetical protein
MTHVAKFAVGGMMLAGLLLSVASLSTRSAEARSHGAISGNPVDGNQAGCFHENFGGVRNDCNGTRRWVMPATLDSNHGITISVRARGVPGTARRVTCQAWSVDGNGLNERKSSVRHTTRHDGATEHLNLSISPHGFGSTYAYCWMDQGTLLRSFHY